MLAVRMRWVAAFGLALSFGCGGSGDAPAEDAGPDAPPVRDASPSDAGEPDAGAQDTGAGDTGAADTGAGADADAVCGSDEACADGVFCNGEELCNPAAPSADAFGCTSSAPPCAAVVCDEDADVCEPECDDDGDGQRDESCGGDDCDDADASVGPGRTEVCNGVDDDCDEGVDEGVSTTFYEDMDGDGFGVSDATTQACARPEGYAPTPGDCDDTVGAIHPASVELCDGGGTDEDCDGVVNEGCDCVSSETRACGAPGACAAGVETCIDGSFGACSISPVSETCNTVDDDCDGAVDETLTVTCWDDADNDGYALDGAPASALCPDSGRPGVGGCPFGTTNVDPETSADCDDTDRTIRPGGTELCDIAMVDEDCDGMLNEDCACAVGTIRACPEPGLCAAGTQSCQASGEWGACTISPGTETCSGADEDCDGFVDETLTVVCWDDADDDGYALSAAGSASVCPVGGRADVGGCPVGSTDRDPNADPDCDDTDPSVSPEGAEVCDASMVDEDCDGVANEGCACSAGAVRGCPEPGACAAGTQTCGASGEWGACSINGTEETCNTVDDDCDGATDEARAGELCDVCADDSVGSPACPDTAGAVDLPEGTTLTYDGVGDTVGDVDHFGVYAIDSPDADLGGASRLDEFGVQIDLADNPGGQYVFDIALFGCAGPLATDLTTFTWPANNPRMCSAASDGDEPCVDDTIYIFIAVRRAAGATPTCEPYRLTISNGV